MNYINVVIHAYIGSRSSRGPHKGSIAQIQILSTAMRTVTDQYRWFSKHLIKQKQRISKYLKGVMQSVR